MLARLFARLERPLLVITYQQEQAQRLWDDLVRFGVSQEQVCVLPSSQSQFLEGDVTDFRIIGERSARSTAACPQRARIVIGTIGAVLQRTSPPGTCSRRFHLHAEQTIDIDDVVTRLVQMGYEAANP